MPAQAAIEVTRFGTIVRSGIISARDRWSRLRRLLPLKRNLPISPFSADGYVYLARLRGSRRTRLRLRTVLARRPDKRAEDAAERLGGLFDEALVLELLENPVDHVLAKFAVRVLAAAILKCELNLATTLEKAPNLVELVVEVVRVGVGMELDFLHLLHLLGFTRLLLPDGLFVLELSVVHDLADGWLSVGRDLDEIEPPLVRETLCVACRHYAEHISLGIKNAQLRHADLEVDTSELCDNSPLFCG